MTDIKTNIQSKIIEQDIIKLSNALSDYKEHFENKIFFITGAAGFLGKYFVTLIQYLNNNILKNPAVVYCVDNFITGYIENQIVSEDNIIFIQHNIINPYEIDSSIDYIIHAAGIASPYYYAKYPIETMDVTTIGTRNMLELARQKKVKGFLFTSSSEVYGDPPDEYIPTPETYKGNVSMSGPRACYDESKRFAEILCTSFSDVYKVPIKIVRYFNVYGPGLKSNDYRVLPNFIERGLRKESLMVHGDGNNTRSYCYINDATEATFKVLFSKVKGEAFNIGNPTQEISNLDLANTVADLLPQKGKVERIKPPHLVYGESDPKRRCPDISKLQSSINFEPKYNLVVGVKRTIQWYLGN